MNLQYYKRTSMQKEVDRAVELRYEGVETSEKSQPAQTSYY